MNTHRNQVFIYGFTGLLLITAACNNTVDSGNHNEQENTLEDGLVYSNEEVGEREDKTGAFRTNCLESHESNDDPLVFPGQPGMAHHHVFFGNPLVDAHTTSESLQEATETSCDGKTLNKSAYWVPALFDQHGELIEYIDPLFYYKTGYHVPAQSIQTLPEGLKIIAGNAMTREPQGTQAIKFRCNSWESDVDWFDPGDPLDHVDYLPDCVTDDILEIRILFPQCWDGQNLSSEDHQSHMAYPSRATPPVAGTGSCPSSHPIALPEISYNFGIYVTEDRGSPSTWRFSSDLHKGTSGGITAHADWMNGWDPDIMERIVEQCLKPAKECMVGLLGDGTRLESVIEE
jgi:hypothetical protein